MSNISSLLSRIRVRRQPDRAPAPLQQRSPKASEYKLDWVSVGGLEGVLRCGKQRVHVCLPDAMAGKPSSPSDFILLKTPGMVEEFIKIVRALEPKNIFELGVFKGGSVVAYNEILRPRKLVAVDLMPQTIDNLDQYVRSPDASERVSIYPGVNQADHQRLAQICADEFRGEPLDVVVDDASHFLHETREAFRELFPRVRPGGVYVIEDWAWAHWRGDHWQVNRGGGYFKGKEPMSSFIVELMAMCPSRPSLVEEVLIKPASVYIVRGWEEIEPGFDPSRFWLNRGAALPRFRT